MSLASAVLLGIQRIGAEFKSVRASLAQRQTAYDAAGLLSSPVAWQGTATTLSDGTWSVSFPTGLFAKPPLIFAQAISPGATAANTMIAAPWAPTISGCGGHVVTGNLLTTVLINTGANGLKLAGQGFTVHVVARAVR